MAGTAELRLVIFCIRLGPAGAIIMNCDRRARLLLLLAFILSGCQQEQPPPSARSDEETAKRSTVADGESDEMEEPAAATEFVPREDLEGFHEVVVATGDAYVRAREKLLGKEGVEEFLEYVSEVESRPDEVRWLAEILLLRKRRPEEFERLEKDFFQKASVTYDSGARVFRAFVSPVLLPSQGELAAEESDVDDDRTDRWRSFKRQKRLVESPLWGLVAGEVVLKGWTRTPEPVAGIMGGVAVMEASTRTPGHPSNVHIGYLGADGKPVAILGPGGVGGPLGTIRGTPYLSRWVYRHSAISVLGHLKEQRARVPLERIILDSTQHEKVAVEATIALYRLGDPRAIDALSSVALDWKRDEDVRRTVLPVLVNLSKTKALPVLKQLSRRETADRAVFSTVNHLLLHIANRPDEEVRVPGAE